MKLESICETSGYAPGHFSIFDETEYSPFTRAYSYGVIHSLSKIAFKVPGMGNASKGK